MGGVSLAIPLRPQNEPQQNLARLRLQSRQASSTLSVMPHAAASVAPLALPMAGQGAPPSPSPAPPTVRTATLIGSGAVLVWSTAASFAVLGSAVPPLVFLAGAFASGFLAFVAARLLRGQSPLEMLAVPLPVLCLMVVGFLGHNGLYVTALRYAPAAQVNLISYLWPLLMVALLGLLGIARPTALQLLGSLLGFAGLAWFVSPGFAADGAGNSLFGYLLAFFAACCFALYSALRARLPGGPPDAAGAACGVAALVAAGLHLLIGAPGAPDALLQVEPLAILAMVLIGIGPMGLANLLWDYGVRFGDGRVLSTLAYLTPLLSTLLLMVLGLAVLTSQVLIGGGLILGGIALAALGARRS